MASTVPAKSQPLHNFNLPRLKWNQDGDSSGHHHHHRRRSVKSPLRRCNPPSASPLRQSPLRDSVSASSPCQYPLRDSVSASTTFSSDNLVKRSPISAGEPCKQSPANEWVKDSLLGTESVKKSPIRGELMKQFHKRDTCGDSEAPGRNKSGLIEYKRSHSRNSSSVIKNEAHASTLGQVAEKSEKQKVVDLDEGKINIQKILIKIPCSNKQGEDGAVEEPPNNNEKDDIGEEGKMQCNDEETKTWNFRPRKPTRKSISANGIKITGAVLSDKNKAQSPSRNITCRSGENEGRCSIGAEKKEKRKLSILISLSKVEIEEDIFSLTGSKPARRPKKRGKSIQKQVDFILPGQWLVSITPESYKVSENYLKV